MKTNYQLPTTELTQAGTFFANLGLECPWVGEDAWCDLEKNYIRGSRWALKTDAYALCPPAVAAAVVWFAVQVSLWDGGEFFTNEWEFGAEQAAKYILGVWQAMENDDGCIHQ